jgi:TRAP-type C4-dicarboxylate transport system permease small subunit
MWVRALLGAEVRGPVERHTPLLKRFNDGLARGEAAIAVGMLLLMIVVAFAQALFRNLTNIGVGWANAALSMIDWADFLLSRGTLWLAFLGASLAVYEDKHVAIDVLPKLVSPKARMLMRIGVGVVGAITCFYLARAFFTGVVINGEERPATYELLLDSGAIHTCDATAAQLAEADARKTSYCAVRSIFKMFGLTIETPGAAFEMIVPVMFLFMCARYFAYFIRDIGRLSRGELDTEGGEHGITASVADVAHDLDTHEKGR